MWDVELKQQFKGHNGAVTGFSYNPSRNEFASTSEENTFLLWQINQKGRYRCMNGHSDIVTGVDYSSDGNLLASCSTDETVRIWLTEEDERGKSVEFKAHNLPVRTVAFSDKDKVVTGSDDKTLKLFDVNTKRCLTTLEGHTQQIRNIKSIKNSTNVVSCSRDHTVQIWDLKSKQSVHTYTFKAFPVSLSMNSSGNYLAVAMSSGSIRIYDLRTHELQQHYTLHSNTTNVCWHPKLQYLLSTGLEGKVKIVDTTEARVIYTLSSDVSSSLCVSFSHDGHHFVSGGTDRLIKLYQFKLS